MRKITLDIVKSFRNGLTRKIGNSRTDGESLWLFENKIAEWRHEELWICNGGWNSVTTKERLNGLPGVKIQQVNGTWYLNSREWNGGWVSVIAWSNGDTREISRRSEPEEIEPEFDVTSEWMPKGYSRPIYSIYHTLIQQNVKPVESMLNEQGIPTKRMESDTSGVYQPNYFVVVRPEDVVRASSILCESYCLS